MAFPHSGVWRRRGRPFRNLISQRAKLDRPSVSRAGPTIADFGTMRSQENALYQRALKFLNRRTNYETFKSIPYDQMESSLARLREFLAFLGNPEKRFIIVHVAGTKGKGTTCAALDRIYRAAGYRVGLFTSPHLDEVTERFQINGKNCPKTLFAETLLRLAGKWKEFAAIKRRQALDLFDSDADPCVEKPTFFEWALILAVSLFARAGVDVAILEVGLGGRFDATNACDADVSVVTSVSYDHCEQLGSTLEAIAGEKLGIVKSNAPLVSGIGFSKFLMHEPLEEPPELEPCEEDASGEKKELKKHTEEDWLRQERALLRIDPQTQISDRELDAVCALARERAQKFGAPFYQIDGISTLVESFPTPPFDSVRRWNFEIALKVVDILAARTGAPEGRTLKNGDSDKEGERLNLPVPASAIQSAAENFEIPARFEVVSKNPLIIVDGAHNRASVAAFMLSARERLKDRKIKILFATTVGKDIRGMIAEMAPIADEIILTERGKDGRATSIADLIQITEETLNETCSEDSPLRRKFRVVPDFQAYLADYCTRANQNNDALCAIGSFYFAAEVRRKIKSR